MIRMLMGSRSVRVAPSESREYSKEVLNSPGGGRTSVATRGRRFKNAIYDQFARVAKALASPHRIELLELLTQGPRTVEALSRLADITLPNTSAHLQVLRCAGLVESTKEGLHVTYRLA